MAVDATDRVLARSQRRRTERNARSAEHVAAWQAYRIRESVPANAAIILGESGRCIDRC
jgi:hypothetical protein